MDKDTKTVQRETGGHEAPAHVAIIMDGNGRWARQRGLPRTAGHKKGAESVRAVIRAAVECGVSYLTLYGFSSENWSRPKDEVLDLMGLLRHYLKSEIAELHAEGVRLRIIGERERLDKDIQQMIEAAEALTESNTHLTLIIALSYGGRDELVHAARAVARKVESGEMAVDEVDETVLSENLLTAGIPDPDLLIRTSGEKRISNFLLWQMAYTEFVFTDVLWPDFGRDDFVRAIGEYHGRDRRYGKTSG